MWPFKKKIKLEVGQVWRQSSDDPFDTIFLRAEILDLRNSWVKYKQFYKENLNHKYTDVTGTTEEGLFRIRFPILVSKDEN